MRLKITMSYLSSMIFFIMFFGTFGFLYSIMSLVLSVYSNDVTPGMIESARELLGILPYYLNNPAVVIACCFLIVCPALYSIHYIKDMVKDKTGLLPTDTHSGLWGALYALFMVMLGLCSGLVLTLVGAITLDSVVDVMALPYFGIAFAVCGVVTAAVNIIVTNFYSSFADKIAKKRQEEFEAKLDEYGYVKQFEVK